MKATLEFELPANLDDYRDAVNGKRWREYIDDMESILLVFRDIDENEDRKKTLAEICQHIQSERQRAGLTFYSESEWQEDRATQRKLWADQLKK